MGKLNDKDTIALLKLLLMKVVMRNAFFCYINKGFTLSELLISLSVLGLISSLTLPQVFNSVNNSKRKAVFKETLNMLNVMAQDASNNGGQASEGMPCFKVN
jgi:prepilin-type N-terminal cleavage/methylation domain-containing protein